MKWIIINPRQFWLLLGAALMGVMGYSFFTEYSVGIDHYIISGLCLLFCLVCIFGCFITPVFIIFSKDEVRLVYLTGRKRWVRWSDVDAVCIVEDGSGKARYLHSYEILPMEGKDCFFSDGMIPKSIAAKILIHRYRKDEIIGEWRWYKVKRWFREKFGEKEKPPKKRRGKR